MYSNSVTSLNTKHQDFSFDYYICLMYSNNSIFMYQLKQDKIYTNNSYIFPTVLRNTFNQWATNDIIAF